MAPIVSYPCPCGRKINASDPEPGQEMRCYYCGHTITYGGGTGDGDGAVAGADSVESMPTRMHRLGELIDNLEPADLTCPSCAAPMRVTLSDDGDKGAVCEHCGRMTDLPERRGVTRTRTIRRPGQTDIIEESAWTEETCRRVVVPDAPAGADDDESFLLPEGAESEITIDFSGDPDDPAAFVELLQKIKERLPPRQAQAVLAEMKRMMRHGR